MKDNITEQQMVEHCAKLLWGYNWTSCHREDKDTECVSTKWCDYHIPKGLCDEDKFLCFVLGLVSDSCIYSRFYNLAFGWTSYKTKKIRKMMPFIVTDFCVGENGGYDGRGWAVDKSFMKKINEYQKKNRCCIDCAKPFTVKIDGEFIKDDTHYCPINHGIISDRDSDHCDTIKLVMDDEFKNFWK